VWKTALASDSHTTLAEHSTNYSIFSSNDRCGSGFFSPRFLSGLSRSSVFFSFQFKDVIEKSLREFKRPRVFSTSRSTHLPLAIISMLHATIPFIRHPPTHTKFHHLPNREPIMQTKDQTFTRRMGTSTIVDVGIESLWILLLSIHTRKVKVITVASSFSL
jgi:hypothetical protein